MQKFWLTSGFIACLAVSAFGETYRTPIAKDALCEVEFYTPQIVRIVKYPASKEQAPDVLNLVVTLRPEDVKVSSSENASTLTLKSSALTVTVDKKSGNVQFARRGATLLRERDFGFAQRNEGVDKGSYEVSQAFTLAKDEAIYGIGAIQDGAMNRRGTHIFMEQSNLQDFHNVIQSQRGWCLYWDNYSRTHFDDDAATGMKFASEVGDCIDYYFMDGGSFDGNVALMRRLTGEVPMMPLWTYGYWQSKERYKTQDETVGIVEQYRKLGVPLDGIVQDWQYWGSNYTWNAMEFCGETFPDGRGMVRKVHDLGAHLMISIWSSFGPMTKQYKQLDEKGLLFDIETWPQSGLSHIWPPRMDYPSGVRVYDVFSSEARDIYWDNLRRLYDDGVDAWWMDSTDPDYFNPKDQEYEHITGLGSWRKVRNAFSLCATKGVFEHHRATSDHQRIFIMSRSTFAGQQRYAAGIWSGDVGSSWQSLRAQLPICLNVTASGNPFVNTDIGGFFAGSYNNRTPQSGARNPQYQELYVRWMQAMIGAPVFRSHGADVPREIWQFGQKGEPVYDAIEKTIRLRYQLLPYIYSTGWQATKGSMSFFRPLVSEFASDRRTWDLGDEYLFGKNFLVAPIVDAQYTEEKIVKTDAMSGWDKQKTDDKVMADVDFTVAKSATKYLPKGLWYEFATNKTYQGGRDVTFETKLDEVPMFVRAGSIVPLAPVVQYVGEKDWSNLEIRVYEGEDGSFTLYEDEGDNYNYEVGQFTEIPMRYCSACKMLIIDDRKGQFNGMLEDRTFTVRLITRKGTVQEKKIKYDGQRVNVVF